MIIVDDLRPDLRSAGESFMHTPNIDRLAKSGVSFERAYCQQAICGPTRNSFLSGRRPQRTKAWNFINHFREAGPDWVSFPQYFKERGYTTLATGKTFHPNLPPNWDQPYSWSTDEPYYFAPHAYPSCSEWPKSLACPTDEPLDTFADWLDMNVSRTQLRKYAAKPQPKPQQPQSPPQEEESERPFFLVFGAHRPHLPWHIPRSFWDLYGPTESVALPTHEAAPRDMPPVAFTYECDGKTEMTAFDQKAATPYPNSSTALPHNMTRSFRRGYYAAVSFTDYLIGELLDTLDEMGVRNDTVVALIGDHGWQLGEHNIWGKHTNFELGTRVPLIVSAPGQPAGAVSTALVESVDLYPTIASLAGLETPTDVDGTDLTPLMAAARTHAATGGGGEQPPSVHGKQAVYSEYPRCYHNVSTPWDDSTSCVHTARTNFSAMGYSVRTALWRYTIWLHWDGARLQGDFSRAPVAVELYGHAGDTEADMDAYENANVAAEPKHKATLESMYALAQAHWDGKAKEELARVREIDAAGGAPAGNEDPKLQFEVWEE